MKIYRDDISDYQSDQPQDESRLKRAEQLAKTRAKVVSGIIRWCGYLTLSFVGSLLSTSLLRSSISAREWRFPVLLGLTGSLISVDNLILRRSFGLRYFLLGISFTAGVSTVLMYQLIFCATSEVYAGVITVAGLMQRHLSFKL